MLSLESIIRKHNVSFHCYSDDTQIYVPLKRSGKNSLEPLLACLNDIQTWIFLKLSENKTKMIFFDPPDDRPMHRPQIHQLSSSVNTSVKNPGVLLDSCLEI